MSGGSVVRREALLEPDPHARKACKGALLADASARGSFGFLCLEPGQRLIVLGCIGSARVVCLRFCGPCCRPARVAR